jgi:hypothetical protein
VKTGKYESTSYVNRLGFIVAASMALAACGGTSSSDLTSGVGDSFDEPKLVAVPKAICGPDDWPETGIQGRVSRQDHLDGLAAHGFRCNTELVGAFGNTDFTVGTIAGYRVHRYVDEAGNECGYYDTTLLPPTNAGDANLGVRVLDMSDPSNPELSMILTSPAMLSPHESLAINQERGLLGAVMGNLSQAVLPGIVDIYDISKNCLLPSLKSSTPLGVYGHEGAFSPDGTIYYSASQSTETIVALDITILEAPVPIWVGNFVTHGLSISNDGTRAYLASTEPDDEGFGFAILDITEVQDRVLNPTVTRISNITWESVSIPQSTVPITIGGKPYVIETDEFGGQVKTGVARIIDISDETNPKVISNIRLDVHQPENFDDQAGDPGVDTPLLTVQGYTAHFCTTPTRVDPKIVACGMAVSGLRIFDIRDPYNPKEVAYFNAPVAERAYPEGSNWAYSSPTFVPERKEIWYSDAFNGFFAVKVTNGAWPD